jgi:hypothetical protein
MKFDAVYLERVCEGKVTVPPYMQLLYAFAEKIRDGDVVAIVGCGEFPISPNELEKLCSNKDIHIVGIDPAFRYAERTDKIQFERKIFEDVLGVEKIQGLSIPQQVVYHTVKQKPRVVGVHGCGCNEHNNSKTLALDFIDLEFNNYMDDISLFLKRNDYVVQNFVNENFSVLAERKIAPMLTSDPEKPKGMSDGLYEFLKRRGHVD